MNTAMIVVLVGVCLFGGTVADDPVEVMFTGSKKPSGSKGGLLGCKPLSTSSVPGPMVRFQALRSGGVEYTRTLVPSERMTFSDVVATNSSSPDIAECAKAATKQKWGAFSFDGGQCVGYKIGEGICPCTKGDLVIFLAKGAIRRPSSARPFTAAKGRAAAPAPAGYIRKIIYPTVSMVDNNFKAAEETCEEIIAADGIDAPLLLHYANGKCYYTDGYSPSPCDSCAGTATEILLKKHSDTEINLLSNCGGTITPETAEVMKFYHIYSHEGFGCIPYPGPASDNNCDITILCPSATTITVSAFGRYIDIDESAGVTCAGDELFVYDGPADGSSCKKKSTSPIYGLSTQKNVTIRFQRKPANKKNIVNKGFYFDVWSDV